MNVKKTLSLYGLKWNPFSPELPIEALLVTPRLSISPGASSSSSRRGASQ